MTTEAESLPVTVNNALLQSGIVILDAATMDDLFERFIAKVDNLESKYSELQSDLIQTNGRIGANFGFIRHAQGGVAELKEEFETMEESWQEKHDVIDEDLSKLKKTGRRLNKKVNDLEDDFIDSDLYAIQNHANLTRLYDAYNALEQKFEKVSTLFENIGEVLQEQEDAMLQSDSQKLEKIAGLFQDIGANLADIEPVSQQGLPTFFSDSDLG